MIKTIVAVAKGVLLVLFSLSCLHCGASEDLCTTLAGIDTKAKVGNCKSVEISETFDKTKCQAALPKCSSDEVQKLTQFADCIKALSNCDASKEDAFIGEFIICAAYGSDLSKECKTIIESTK